MEITVKAAAKINLLLDLTATFQNGYHSIYTVMQSVSLYDTVHMAVSDSGKINLSCNLSYIPIDDRNTAYKAAQLFFDTTKIKFSGIDININKSIPSQAGMAGGSADAAAVICGLNKLYNAGLSKKQLFAMGESIGADVPFCIAGGTRLCLNKGEVMAQLPDLPNCYIVIVKPDQGVSTKKAYENYDNAEWIRHPDNNGFLLAATKQDIKTMCAKAANVFEQVVEVRDRVRIKAIMHNNNAMLAMMTGSGAAVFGIFNNKSDAVICEHELQTQFDNVYFAKPETNGLYYL